MKPLARDFSMTGGPIVGLAALALLIAAPASAWAENACASSELLPADLVAAAKGQHPYPSFCSIPPVPVVPPPEHYRVEVSETRAAGAQLVADTSAATWTLDATDSFAASAKSEATAPPPIPNETDTEAFIQEMKRRATPPPRPR